MGKGKKLLTIFLIVFTLIGTSPGQLFTGTNIYATDNAHAATRVANDVTVIKTADELASMTGDKSYVLGNDITLSKSWQAKNFSGNLDGKGHTVTLDGQPLFNEFNGHYIRNLEIAGEVYDTRGDAGILCYKITKGNIENCLFTANITPTGKSFYSDVSGITDNATGTGQVYIKNCLVAGELRQKGESFKRNKVWPLVKKSNIAAHFKNNGYCTDSKNKAIGGQGIDEGDNEKLDLKDTQKIINKFNAQLESKWLKWSVKDGKISLKETSGTEPNAGDKAPLKKLIDEAKELKATDYTDDSWKTFQEKLTKAEGVYNDAKATQQQVDTARYDLQAAKDALKAKSDKRALKSVIDSSKSLIGEYFTPETWKPFKKSLDEADRVYQSPASTQSAVDKAKNDLSAAKSNLKHKSITVEPVALPPGEHWIDISTPEQLENLQGKGYYRLANDIKGFKRTDFILNNFDGVLDGNGHNIEFVSDKKTMLMDTLGKNGVIQNTGFYCKENPVGSGAKSAVVNDLKGKIINCFVHKVGSNGAFANGVFKSGIIYNCYVTGNYTAAISCVGASGRVIHTFWDRGKSHDIADGLELIDSAKVDGKTLRSKEFLDSLNEKRGANGTLWKSFKDGLPVFNEIKIDHSAPPLKHTITVKDIGIGAGNTQTITYNDEVISLDCLGDETGYIGEVSLDNYDKKVIWNVEDTNIFVINSKNKIYAKTTGSSKVTVLDADDPEGPPIATFKVEILPPDSGNIHIYSKDGKDITSSEYDITGKDSQELSVKFDTGDGVQHKIPSHIVNWSSSDTTVINVSSLGDLWIKKEGNVQVTVTLGNITADTTLFNKYIPVEKIEPNHKGLYIIHSRNPNSIGQSAAPGTANFSPLQWDPNNLSSAQKLAKVTPETATYKDAYKIVSSDNSIIEYLAAYQNVLVPYKEGKVTLTVTSLDPKLDHTVSGTSQIELKFFNPLTSLKVKKEKLDVKVGESVSAGLEFEGPKSKEGYHVTESNMVWTQTGTGKVSAYRKYPVVMLSDPDGSVKEGVVSQDKWFIKGVKAGDVVLHGKPVDSDNGAKPVTLYIHIAKDTSKPDVPVKERVEKLRQKTSKYIYDNLQDPSFGSEWAILGLARAGYPVKEGYYKGYLEKVKPVISSNKGNTNNPWDNKVTETQRLSLALGSIGVNPTAVPISGEKVDITKYSWNKPAYFKSLGPEKSKLGGSQGSNELIFALLSSDLNKNMKRPCEANIKTKDVINKLLTDYQLKDGGFGLSDNKTTSSDITAMALQALAKYKDQPEVKKAIDLALTKLSSMQQETGSFGTAESDAQVIIALTELGIDPNTDSRFVKDGVSLVDAFLGYAKDNGAFEHIKDQGINGMSTEQGHCALIALERFYESKNSFYNMNDVNMEASPDGCEPAPNTGDHKVVKVQSVSLSPKKMTLAIGQKESLTAKITPSDATDKSLEYKSSDYKIATVDQSGNVKGIAEGKATITVTTKDGSKTDTAEVTVTAKGNPVTKISISPRGGEIEQGKTLQLKADVTPSDATDKTVVWSSADKSIADVNDSGLVTGHKEGKTVIKAASKAGDVSDSVEITVKKADTSNMTEEATISIDKFTIDKGWVIKPIKVKFKEGESAWDVTKRAMDDNNIKYRFKYYENYGSIYVQWIDGDGEFDHGSGSGWMYSVNGVFPDKGAGLYKLQEGDVIRWRYTTNLGEDVRPKMSDHISSADGKVQVIFPKAVDISELKLVVTPLDKTYPQFDSDKQQVQDIHFESPDGSIIDAKSLTGGEPFKVNLKLANSLQKPDAKRHLYWDNNGNLVQLDKTPGKVHFEKDSVLFDTTHFSTYIVAMEKEGSPNKPNPDKPVNPNKPNPDKPISPNHPVNPGAPGSDGKTGPGHSNSSGSATSGNNNPYMGDSAPNVLIYTILLLASASSICLCFRRKNK